MLSAKNFRLQPGLFQRFDQSKATQLQRNCFNWLFVKLNLNRITLDVDSTVITRLSQQIQGAFRLCNPKNHGRNSHHLLIAFVADWRLVANFWLRLQQQQRTVIYSGNAGQFRPNEGRLVQG